MAHQLQEQTQEQTSPSEIRIREELDSANKKVDRYVRLVASLSEELDNLRTSICHNCKQNFVPSYSPSVEAGPHPTPLWRRIITGWQTQTTPSGLPSVLPTNAASPDTSIPDIRFITAQQTQINSTILAPDSSSSTPPRQPPTKSVDEVKSKHPSWSVSHNPGIKQALHINLVKTFDFTAKVICVKFSPDGKYLAVGLGDWSGKTYIYDVEKGLKICVLMDLYLKDQRSVWGVQFSPDNKLIATASSRRIRLWEIARKRTRGVFLCNPARVISVCFSPNGRSLVASEGDNVIIWSLRDGSSKNLSEGGTDTYSITFSPDGRHIVSVDYHSNGWLRIWDARAGQLLDKWMGHPMGLCVAFSPDGKGLVSGGSDGILRYWDVSSLAVIQTGRDRVVDGNPGQRFDLIRKFEGHTSWIRSVSFSPDHQWVATSSEDTSVRIWDPRTAEVAMYAART